MQEQLLQEYVEQIQKMLDSYIKVMSTAIDARTPYNANHTRNMVVYAQHFLQWMEEQHLPQAFDEKKTREFIMSIWMHDIGKLITPIEIMDKQDRLADNYECIVQRFAKIRLLARIDCLEGRISPEQLQERLGQIVEAAGLVRTVNGITQLTDELEQQVLQLAARTYTEENGEICTWVTPEETEQLLIRTGTLTETERDVMRDHVEKTRIMLEQMTFGADYSHVCLWASQHHELLNGTGYPKGLCGDEICMEVRLLTILDIFEAMTALDRPYKQPMPVEHALELLYQMADAGAVDAQLLDLFERSRAWETDEDSRKDKIDEDR